jgi:hypothetical protein
MPNLIIWNVDNVQSIAGHQTTVLGRPKPVQSPRGPAVEFDGAQDALQVDAFPLAGAEKFTLETIFRPDAGGAKEQRFLHCQEKGKEHRILIETRLLPEGRWFLDTFIKSEAGEKTLFADKFLHPAGEWYHAALVYDGAVMRHYVDGREEMSAAIAYKPLGAAAVSIGVRINKVFWFKGAIRSVRFAAEALNPSEFMKW